MPFVAEALAAALPELTEPPKIVFVDQEAGGEVNGVPVISEQDFLSHAGSRYFSLGIADGDVRRRLAARLESADAVPVTLIAPTAQVFSPSRIGAGSILCPNTIVTVNVEVGRHVHLNLFSYIEHDCRIGDFVTFAPGVKCNGAVEIGEGAYIGSGASLRQGTLIERLRIGAGATVGMGAAVIHNVAPATTVVGVPARPVQKGKA